MSKVQQRITNSLWFDSEAEKAARFYTSIFPDSSLGPITYYGKAGHEQHKQPEGKVLTVTFRLSGLEFTALNGGPEFKLNPSISYFVVCETEDELDTLWQKLLEGGQVLMPLKKYDWSEKYGWVQDQYGLSWQLTIGKISDVGQKITPSLMFVNQQLGHAEEAVNFYTSIFKDSGIDGILKYEKGEPQPEGTVKHAQFKLSGQTFMVMDSGMKHDFNFSEAISLIVNCDTQTEIDYYWHALTKGGEEGPCGWLKDKFGVSWQIVPVAITEMLLSSDKAKTEAVTEAFMKMKKFDLRKLQEVFEKA